MAYVKGTMRPKKIVEVYAHKIKWKPTKQYPAKPNSKKIL